MAILEVRLTEPMRQKFALILAFLNILGAFFSLCLIGIGTYIKVVIEQKINLTDDYNNDVLPWMMIAIGLIDLCVNCVGAYLAMQSRDVENRLKLRQIQLPFVCISLFAAICVFASAMMSFAHVGHLHNSFGNGLVEAMKQYKTDSAIKEDIDVLQMEYECCGAYDFSDWFKISWIANQYLDIESTTVQGRMVHGEYYNDDAPYSCCDPSAMRPCIHHHITKDEAHFLYNHEEQTTLYTTGCRQALMDYFSEILYESSIVIIVIFCVQILITLGMRYHQTSIWEAIETGDAEADAPGYLFGGLAPEFDRSRGGGGDFSSDSSHAVYESVKNVKRNSSTGSRGRGSGVGRKGSRSLSEYDNIQGRGSTRRYDTNTEDQTE